MMEYIIKWNTFLYGEIIIHTDTKDEAKEKVRQLFYKNKLIKSSWTSGGNLEFDNIMPHRVVKNKDD